MNTLGEKLKIERRKRNLTQDDIAKMLDINRVTYYGYETDKHEPNLKILCKLAEIFQVSTDYLLGRYA